MLAMSVNGVVSRPVANLYSGPDLDRDVVTQAIYATNVDVVEEREGWARVRTPDDYSGWMQASDFLKSAPYAASGKIAYVESLFANLYRESSITRHAPLLTVPFETRLEIVAERDAGERRWVQVRLPDDRAAWVQRGDVVFAPVAQSLGEAMEFGRRFIGLPYLWGGTSTLGYDCSGYIQMLFRRQGLTIPRDAGPQSRWEGFVSVSTDDLRPGDLLYFGPSEQKITHTGMYTGAGRFINATAHLTPMVQISDLADPHWQPIFVAARRLK